MKKYSKEELDDLNGITSSRRGFILPFSVIEFLSRMNVEESGIAIKSIHHYVTADQPFEYIRDDTKEKVVIPNNSLPGIALQMFIDMYSKDAPKYLAEVKKRRESGSKGGTAKAQSNT